MAGHVAQGPGAKVPPAAVLEGMVEAGPVFPRWRHAEPVFPVQPLERLADFLLLLLEQVLNDLRHLLGGGRRILLPVDLGHRLGLVFADVHAAIRPLRPDGAIRPRVDLFEGAEDARTELGDRLAGGVERRALVAHLRADALGGHLLRNVGQQPRLVDRPRQRLLRVAADAQPHRIERGWGMHVVRRADGADVDVFAVLGEQFAVVGEPLSIFELLRAALLFERVAIDVADRDHVAEERRVVGVAATLAAHADAGDVELFTGRLAPGLAATGGNEIAGSGHGCGLKETATGGCGHARLLSVIRA